MKREANQLNWHLLTTWSRFSVQYDWHKHWTIHIFQRKFHLQSQGEHLKKKITSVFHFVQSPPDCWRVLFYSSVPIAMTTDNTNKWIYRTRIRVRQTEKIYRLYIVSIFLIRGVITWKIDKIFKRKNNAYLAVLW